MFRKYAIKTYYADEQSPAEAYQELVDFIEEFYGYFEIAYQTFEQNLIMWGGDSQITIEFYA